MIFNWKSKKDWAIATLVGVVSILYFVKELRDRNEIRQTEMRIHQLERMLEFQR